LTDVEVVLTDNSAGITGNVIDARAGGDRLHRHRLRDTRRPLVSGIQILHLHSTESGWHIRGRRSPPGDYFIAASTLAGRRGFGEWQDPAFLESIAPRATRVTLADGQLASVALRLIVR